MPSATESKSAPQRMLCWTVCAYRKPGLDEDEYHRHMSEVHAPLVKKLMVKYDFVQWSMVCAHRFPNFPVQESKTSHSRNG